MRQKSRMLKQKEKHRLSIFLRPDQYEDLTIIKESADTYMLDVIEEIIDLGLRSYYEDPRETRGIGNILYKDEDPSFLYD